MKNYDFNNINYELLTNVKKEKKKTKILKGEKVKFCLYIDKKLLKKLKIYAINNDISISNKIESLINDFFSK